MRVWCWLGAIRTCADTCAPIRGAPHRLTLPPHGLVLQVELRNRRFEEHSALIGHASFLRRSKKPRSLSFNDTGGGRAGLSASAGAAAAAAAAPNRRHGAATEIEAELRKPRPLDLPAVVTPGVTKNQGTDAEEAFRAVGLTASGGGAEAAKKAREQHTAAGGSDGSQLPAAADLEEASPPPLSPPHLFWKAVVVAPSRTRGNVGAWLEAKFGGGAADGVADGAAEGVAKYRRDLVSHGLCPGLEEGWLSGSGVGDNEEITCGGSGSSKLIYRALRSGLVGLKINRASPEFPRHASQIVLSGRTSCHDDQILCFLSPLTDLSLCLVLRTTIFVPRAENYRQAFPRGRGGPPRSLRGGFICVFSA